MGKSPSTAEATSSGSSAWNTVRDQIIVAIGLYASFLLWGYLQEDITKKTWLVNAETGEREKFRNSLVLMFFQASGTLIVATFILGIFGRGNSVVPGSTFSRRPGTKPPPYKGFYKQIMLCCFAAILGPQFAYASMARIPYPAVQTVKMGKMIPALLVGALWHQISYGSKKITNAVVITIGVLAFVGLESPSGSGAASSSSSGGEERSYETLLTGLGLCFTGMVIDGYLGSTQALVMKKMKLGSFLMMFLMGMTCIVVTSSLLILFESVFETYGGVPAVDVSGGVARSFVSDYLWILEELGFRQEISSSLTFFELNPELFQKIALLSLMNAFGQCFIFAGLSKFGVVTTIALTLSRKVFTVLVSIVAHNHSFSPQQWVGLLIVFGGVIFDCYMNVTESAKRSSSGSGGSTIGSSGSTAGTQHGRSGSVHGDVQTPLQSPAKSKNE